MLILRSKVTPQSLPGRDGLDARHGLQSMLCAQRLELNLCRNTGQRIAQQKIFCARFFLLLSSQVRSNSALGHGTQFHKRQDFQGLRGPTQLHLPSRLGWSVHASLQLHLQSLILVGESHRSRGGYSFLGWDACYQAYRSCVVLYEYKRHINCFAIRPGYRYDLLKGLTVLRGFRGNGCGLVEGDL